jgi:hypothetical protein
VLDPRTSVETHKLPRTGNKQQQESAVARPEVKSKRACRTSIRELQCAASPEPQGAKRKEKTFAAPIVQRKSKRIKILAESSPTDTPDGAREGSALASSGPEGQSPLNADRELAFLCEYCLALRRKNELGRYEHLLKCHSCCSLAHPTCMGYTPHEARHAQRRKWQCIDCQVCAVCDSNDPALNDEIIFCRQCSTGYHRSCHAPQVRIVQTEKWMCASCDDNSGLLAAEKTSHATTESQAATSINMKTERNDNLPTEIRDLPTNTATATSDANCKALRCHPDAAPVRCDSKRDIELLCRALLAPVRSISARLVHEPLLRLQDWQLTEIFTSHETDLFENAVFESLTWSADMVKMFIEHLGFPELSYKFKEQEIDGQSLLLLRREDVLQLLKLKVGPALKLYNRILKLQNLVAASTKRVDE